MKIGFTFLRIVYILFATKKKNKRWHIIHRNCEIRSILWSCEIWSKLWNYTNLDHLGPPQLHIELIRTLKPKCRVGWMDGSIYLRSLVLKEHRQSDANKSVLCTVHPSLPMQWVINVVAFVKPIQSSELGKESLISSKTGETEASEEEVWFLLCSCYNYNLRHPVDSSSEEGSDSDVDKIRLDLSPQPSRHPGCAGGSGGSVESIWTWMTPRWITGFS